MSYMKLISAPQNICLHFSFQELDLSAEAYIVFDGAKEEEWTRAIAESLGSGYQKVWSKAIVELV